jgi:hypothetical protein
MGSDLQDTWAPRRFKPLYLRILYLHVRGYSFKETADITGVTVPTVR